MNRQADAPSIKATNFRFGIEPIRPAYIFLYISYVTVITKNANAVPISFVHPYRIDALALPLVCLAYIAVQGPFSAMCNEHSAKYPPRPPRCPSCAQIILCGSLERPGDLKTYPIVMLMNAELVVCRTSTPFGSRSHENRRRPDGGLGVERRAGVHARLSCRLAPRQEEAIIAQICTRVSYRWRTAGERRGEYRCGSLTDIAGCQFRFSRSFSPTCAVTRS